MNKRKYIARKKFKKAISKYIEGMGHIVEIILNPIKVSCDNCYYDYLSKESTGVCKWSRVEVIYKQEQYESNGGLGIKYKYFDNGLCPVCNNKGTLDIYKKKFIQCKVNFTPDIELNSSAGKVHSNIIELKVKVEHIKLIDNAYKIKVGGVTCRLYEGTYKRGIADTSVVSVMLYTDNVSKINRIEKSYYVK